MLNKRLKISTVWLLTLKKWLKDKLDCYFTKFAAKEKDFFPFPFYLYHRQINLLVEWVSLYASRLSVVLLLHSYYTNK